jgi:23S rRNA (guanosine2251-2'-O)-methyltransferase
MPRQPALRDELLAMTALELAAADAFFDRAAAEPTLDRELEQRLSGPTTPLITALVAWEAAPPEGTTLLAVNETNGARLREIIESSGWPTLRDVGVDGADAAWMLAQHADRSNQARRAWLPLVRDAIETGDADPRHYATLVDRVAAVAGEPQVYGTLALVAADGEVEFPQPVADAGHLEQRRAEIGLPSVRAEAPYLVDGELIPYGPDRGAAPVNQWPMVLEGHVSVEAALEGGVRHVHRIWAVLPGDRRLGRLRAIAHERGVVIEKVDRELIEELASGRSHGGLIALVGPRRDRILAEVLVEVGERSLVVMLDGIEDPFNFGQATRAMYAAGIDALVVRRSWETALSTVTRASAGATELLPTATVQSVEEAATACRMAGFRIACAVRTDDATDLHEADLTGGIFLLIGGERRGVTRSFVEQADVRIRIDYGRDSAPELGAATSAAIIGFEALRQRRNAG